MSSDSSSDNELGPSSGGKFTSREFVWLLEKSKPIPRGRVWDNLNRDGRVKELSFLPSWSSGRMKELVGNSFPALKDHVSRIRLYKSESRGSRITRICTGIPDAKEMLRLCGRSKSKKILMYLKDRQTGTLSSSPPTTKAPSSTAVVSSATQVPTSSLVTIATSTVSTNATPPTTYIAPSTNVSTSTSTNTSTSTSTVSVLTTPSSSPAVGSRLPSNGRSQIAPLYIADDDDGGDSDSLLHSPFYANPSVVSSHQPVPLQRSRARRVTQTSTSTTCSSNTDITFLTGVSEIPFYGGNHVGRLSEDLSVSGLGATTEITSRSDEVARCQSLLQATAVENPVPPFLSHSFEELCWQARETLQAMVIVLLDTTRTSNNKRENILRVLHKVMESENERSWLFWVGETQSEDGKKVLDTFGGDQGKERIIFLAPSLGSKATLIGEISDEDMEDDHDGIIFERVLERIRNLVTDLNQQREQYTIWRAERDQQEIELSQSVEVDSIVNQESSADSAVTNTEQQQIRLARRQRVIPPPGCGYNIVLRGRDGYRMQRLFKKTACFQEVYDWAGSTDRMPLHFTIQRGRTVLKYSDNITGNEVLDIYERDEMEIQKLLTEATVPSAPSEPSAPTVSSAPSEPSAPTVPSAPSEPSAPTVPSAPSEPSAPTVPSAPSEPSEPSAPTVSSVPTVSSAPTVPSVPTVSSALTMPSETATTTTTITISTSEKNESEDEQKNKRKRKEKRKRSERRKKKREEE